MELSPSLLSTLPSVVFAPPSLVAGTLVVDGKEGSVLVVDGKEGSVILLQTSPVDLQLEGYNLRPLQRLQMYVVGPVTDQGPFIVVCLLPTGSLLAAAHRLLIGCS